MKKILLTMGAMTTVALPITMAISCSSEEKDPTFGEVYKLSIAENLMSDKVLKKGFTFSTKQKSDFVRSISTNDQAKELSNVPIGVDHSTVAAWTNFVNTSTSDQLYLVFKYNSGAFFSVTFDAQTSLEDNHNLIKPQNTKEELIKKVEAVIKNDGKLLNKYKEIINNSDSALSAYYKLDFINTSVNEATLKIGSGVINPKAFTKPEYASLLKGLKTAKEKSFAIIKHKSYSGGTSIKEIARGLMSKFDGSDSDFDFASNQIYKDATIIFNKKDKTYTFGKTFVSLALQFMVKTNSSDPTNGKLAIEHILSSIGYTYAGPK